MEPLFSRTQYVLPREHSLPESRLDKNYQDLKVPIKLSSDTLDSNKENNSDCCTFCGRLKNAKMRNRTYQERLDESPDKNHIYKLLAKRQKIEADSEVNEQKNDS